MQKKIIIFLCFVLFSSSCLFSQDIHFSQFYMTPLAMNPANAGAEKNEMQAILNYKNQWRSIGSPYKTLAASCDARIKKKRSSTDFAGIGINFFSDNAGDIQMKHFQVNLDAAYHVYLTRKKYSTLGAGIQTGFAQRSISYEGVTWGNQYDGNSYNPMLPTGEPTSATSFKYGDFLGAGVVWVYNNSSGILKVTDNNDFKATAGFSVFHILRPKYSYYESEEKLYIKYVLHGNALISVRHTNIAFAPGFMFYRQGPTQEIYPGTLIRYKLKQASKYTGYYKGTAVSVGAFLRAKDAVALALLMEYSGYAVGMSYDINTSGLTTASQGRGGFEISLKYQSINPFATNVYGGRSKF